MCVIPVSSSAPRKVGRRQMKAWFDLLLPHLSVSHQSEIKSIRRPTNECFDPIVKGWVLDISSF